MEQQEITDEEKENSYKKACDILGVDYNSSKKQIVDLARSLYKKYHPDKNVNKSQEIKDFCEKNFIEVHCSVGFIKAYRTEKGTWTD